MSRRALVRLRWFRAVPVLVLMLAGLGVQAQVAAPSRPAAGKIDTAELATLLAASREKDAAVVLVDVRSDRETAVSVIPGAITAAEFERDAARHRDKLVIPYCTVGGRSGAYARKLAAEGWNVRNYEGSILAWAGSGQPLVTRDGKPTRRLHTFNDRFDAPAGYEQVTD